MYRYTLNYLISFLSIKRKVLFLLHSKRSKSEGGFRKKQRNEVTILFPAISSSSSSCMSTAQTLFGREKGEALQFGTLEKLQGGEALILLVL